MPASTNDRDPAPAQCGFVTTSWTLVVQVGGSDERSRRALAELCQAYWYPLYAFLRRQQMRPEDAEETVQSFFAWLIECNVVGRADPNRGRFRSFLVSALNQFVVREQQYRSAAKRQPELPILQIGADDGQRRYLREPFHEITPEKQFEYSWVMEVINHTMLRLRSEFEQEGKQERFEALQPFLTMPYFSNGRDVANALGMSEGAVRVAVHRLKRRFGEMLRAEVGQTLETDAEIDEEINHLINALKL